MVPLIGSLKCSEKLFIVLTTALVLPLLKERISYSLFHQKMKAQADWKD